LTSSSRSGCSTRWEWPPLGGAGLFSTAEDIARFYQMMLNKGNLHGKRILKPETVAEMTRKQTGELNTPDPACPGGWD
jgi:CubicO group peptidase (beta-lactamase class C family)